MGGALWGTAGGGAPGYGTIFSANVDGSGLTTQYTFTGTVNSSILPNAGLTLVGSALFGTAGGGAPGYGTIFSANVDGKRTHDRSRLHRHRQHQHQPERRLDTCGRDILGHGRQWPF